MTNPATGEPGVLVRFLDAAGGELFREDRRATALVWFGGDAPIAASSVLELSTTLHPGRDGRGPARLRRRRHRPGLRRRRAACTRTPWRPVGTDLGAAFLCAAVEFGGAAACGPGEPIDLSFEYDIVQGGPLAGALAITFGIEPDLSDPDGLIAEAVEAARAADVAVVVVGTNSRVESEGYDRTSLACPAGRTTWSAPWPRRTRAPSSWSTPARRC